MCPDRLDKSGGGGAPQDSVLFGPHPEQWGLLWPALEGPYDTWEVLERQNEARYHGDIGYRHKGTGL